LGVDRYSHDERNFVTAPRVGETFRLDLDGTVIAGRYIEVDPPHRMLLRWDRQGTDTATPTPTFVEITFTPTGDSTNVKVQFSGLSAEDAAFYPQLWARHLDQIAAALASAEPAQGNLRRPCDASREAPQR
jgi:uncharacterized protein YndB with AHSA1/START domain